MVVPSIILGYVALAALCSWIVAHAEGDVPSAIVTGFIPILNVAAAMVVLPEMRRARRRNRERRQRYARESEEAAARQIDRDIEDVLKLIDWTPRVLTPVEALQRDIEDELFDIERSQ